MNLSKPNRYSKIVLFLFLFILILVRASYIGKGALSSADDARYIHSLNAFFHLTKGDISKFSKSISATDGRPGDAFVRLIPASIQFFFKYLFNLSPTHPKSLLIPQIFNVVIGLILVLLFFKICMHIFDNDFTVSLCASIFYALLVNSNIYIRHILPYDMSLLCFFASMWLCLKEAKSNYSHKTCILTGLLSGLGFAVYPGYYFFLIIIIGCISYPLLNNFSIRNVRGVGIFAFTCLMVLSFFEVLCSIGGTSYFIELKRLSKTITQGSFEEGFSFIIKYLIQVEFLSGMFLVVFTFIFIIFIFYKLLTQKGYKKVTRFELIFVIVFVCYLFHATNSVFMHKAVFLGRLLHLFFPFMVLASFLVIKKYQSKLIRNMCLVGSILCLTISFAVFHGQYSDVAYPSDVLINQKIDISSIPDENLIYEMRKVFYDYKRHGKNKSGLKNRQLLLVNLAFYYPITKAFYKFTPSSNMELIYDGLHFQAYKGYMFEGSSIEERKLLSDKQIRISIYKVNS